VGVAPGDVEDFTVAMTSGEGGVKLGDEPRDLLSTLIDTFNEKFGLNLGDADRIYLEQQLAAIMEDQELRTVALHNDRDSYRIALDKRADDIILEGHEANGVLFDKHITDDEFKTFLRQLSCVVLAGKHSHGLLSTDGPCLRRATAKGGPRDRGTLRGIIGASWRGARDAVEERPGRG